MQEVNDVTYRRRSGKNMQENPRIVQEFLDYLAYEKHFSGHTVKCYSADLHQYLGYLTAQGEAAPTEGPPPGLSEAYGPPHGAATATAVALDPAALVLQADINTVRAFLARLNEENYSKATIARKLATLR
ncbi:MAG: hypothetical protein JW810_11370, partial [Sedimentisphaerales bacterium]|nr:hypothetical protein [Sedimentisphaerales bacterium]